jgi:hypothetical protein
MSYADIAPVARRLSACFGAISEIPKPTVAAITGYALGGLLRGGADLLLHLPVERVHRRPVQPDGADAAVDLEPDELTHATASLPRSNFRST